MSRAASSIWRRSSECIQWDGLVNRVRSLPPSCSWPPPTPHSSPVSSCRSTAATWRSRRDGLLDGVGQSDSRTVGQSVRTRVTSQSIADGSDRLTTPNSVYWHTHSRRRPCDHIQAAALALARGSKMSYSANGVPSQVPGLNWNSPYDPPDLLTAVGTRLDSQRATRTMSLRGCP